MTRRSGTRPTRAALRMLTLLAVAAMTTLGPALAGPTTYDPKTRSFRLTYTYAAVPAINSSVQDIAASGTKQNATKEQDAQVRAIQAIASDQLSQATGGRARISSLELVDEIRAADIVVSLTGDPGRAGAADLGTIDGRPGQLRIFYSNIEKYAKNDVALTTLHELFHYLFALPDEYQTNLQAACPATNLNGPGWIMDNYFTGVRNGWYGRLCGPDHNPAAPQPGTVVSNHRAGQSCQELVDNFFRRFDLTEPPPAEVGAVAVPADPDRPFTGPFNNLVAATSSFLRTPAKGQEPAANAATTAESRTSLRVRAERFLREQVAQNRDRRGFVEPTANRLKAAIERAVAEAIAGPAFNPKLAEKPSSRFDAQFIEVLLGKARELARGATPRDVGRNRDFPGRRASPAARDLRDVQLRVGRELVAFAKNSLRLDDRDLPREQRALSPAESKFLEQVARTASSEVSGGSTEFDKYLKAATLHVELNQQIASTVGRIADEVGVPGTESREARIRAINADLSRIDLAGYALPGRTANNFGERKTLLVAPLPKDPAQDFIAMQAGRDVAYSCIRDLTLNQFLRLVNRERPEIVTEDSPSLPGTPPASLSVGRRRSYTADERQAVEDRRYQRLLAILAYLTDEVRRNRVENIVLLVPPGGLPDELGQAFESFRERLLYGANVRLDLVFIGTARVSDRMRDLQVRTGGSALIAFDVDDVGAIAQRLKKEGVTGSWVIPPQKGRIDFTDKTQEYGTEDPAAPPPNVDTSLDAIIGMFEETVRGPLVELNRVQSRLYRAIDGAPLVKAEALEIARPVLDDIAQVRARLKQIRIWLEAIRDNRQVARNVDSIRSAILEIRGMLTLSAGQSDQLQTCLLATDQALDAAIKSTLVRRAQALIVQYRKFEQKALRAEAQAIVLERRGAGPVDQPGGGPKTAEEAWEVAARSHRDAAESAVRAAWLLKSYTGYNHSKLTGRSDGPAAPGWRTQADQLLKRRDEVDGRTRRAGDPIIRGYFGMASKGNEPKSYGGAAQQYRIAAEIASDLAKLRDGNSLIETQYELRRFAGDAYRRGGMALDRGSRGDLRPGDPDAVPMPSRALPAIKPSTISRSKLADFVEVVESEPRDDPFGRLDVILHPSLEADGGRGRNTADTWYEARELVEEDLPVLVNSMHEGIIRIEEMFDRYQANLQSCSAPNLRVWIAV